VPSDLSLATGKERTLFKSVIGDGRKHCNACADEGDEKGLPRARLFFCKRFKSLYSPYSLGVLTSTKRLHSSARRYVDLMTSDASVHPLSAAIEIKNRKMSAAIVGGSVRKKFFSESPRPPGTMRALK
jgi:hypothetical protein